MVKNPPANAGDIRDVGLISGSGRSPGGGHDNPFQYPRLENPMDRGAWRTTVRRVAELDTTEETQHQPVWLDMIVRSCRKTKAADHPMDKAVGKTEWPSVLILAPSLLLCELRRVTEYL